MPEPSHNELIEAASAHLAKFKAKNPHRAADVDQVLRARPQAINVRTSTGAVVERNMVSTLKPSDELRESANAVRMLRQHAHENPESAEEISGLIEKMERRLAALRSEAK